ncbi:hypothetical protein GGR50DRAFT_30497 [Xylaria sp. CBS 124048]|nr:hypothetical protein GGR50DRAFT_30497 [Xylaria sp. CBS 124048]
MPPRKALPELRPSTSRRSSISTPTISKPDSSRRHSRTSSTTTSPPLSPPARLHLRNFLPSSPIKRAFMTPPSPPLPPPPSVPKAWVWQCHLCQTIYPLGCTRRCLECDHTYCASGNPQGKTGPRSSKKRRRPHGGQCAAMFDYTGWEEYGGWRRKALGWESSGRCDPQARDLAFAKGTHNCWLDCDSPSQCNQRRYDLVLEALRQKAHSLEQGDDSSVSSDEPTALTEDVDFSPSSQFEQEPESDPTAEGETWWDSQAGINEDDDEEDCNRSFYDIDDDEDDNDDEDQDQDQDQTWEEADEAEEEEQASPVKNNAAMRDISDDEFIEGSDLDSDSDGSDWSSVSSDSEASSVEMMVDT